MKHSRQQTDTDFDQVSDETATMATEPLITRQEFKDESDLNILLARFGVQNAQQRPMTWGQEIDWNTDLQQAIEAIKQARQAQLNVPAELAAKYPTWRHVLNGAETGEYADDLQKLAKDKADAAAAATAEQTPTPPPAQQKVTGTKKAPVT